MADITNALGFRKLEATTMAAMYYFATLHDAGGSALDATVDAWTGVGMAGELGTGFGYTQGGVALGQGSVATNTNVDTADAVWTASGGSIGPASYCAIWCNTTNTMTGAKLISVKDSSASPQTATDGQTMTGTLANPIQY
jgi:hypothetical protein